VSSSQNPPESAGQSPQGDDGSTPLDAQPGSGSQGGHDSGLQEAGAVLGTALAGLARALLRHGGSRARRAAESGRVRLDLRQLRRDRDVMYQKLGREVIHLVEGGEVDHPGLVRGVERIRELEQRIAEVDASAAAQLDDASLETPTASADPGTDSEGS